MVESLISFNEVVFIILSFAAVMMFIVRSKGGGSIVVDDYLLANRKLNWVSGALSIAVSWVWAPAIFIASLQAYTKGIAGAFWFIFPNILCFFIFAPFAVKLRRLIPEGYSFPDFICHRYKGNVLLHICVLTIFFGYQLGAIIINSLAGAMLLNQVSGINIDVLIIVMPLIAIVYSIKTGLRASVKTDVFQMLFVLVVIFGLIPWVVSEAGGFNTLVSGIGGKSGEFGFFLNPIIAFSFGIPMTLGLISGPFSDQMFFQRAFAVEGKDIGKTFILGGLLFGLVPLLLCLPGFIAAADPSLVVDNPEMVAPIVIAKYLPHWALLLFVWMALCGLSSTLDSSFCAISSLGAIDIYRRYIRKDSSEEEMVRVTRTFMVMFTVIGVMIALTHPKLLWLFLAYGSLASAGFFPVLFSTYFKNISSKALVISIFSAILIGLPFSIYANILEDSNLIVCSALFSFFIGLPICLIDVTIFRNKRQWHNASC